MKTYQVAKFTYKFYKKGDHDKLLGHTMFVKLPYVSDDLKIKEDFIVLTQKDLFLAAIKKQEYFDSL